MLFEISMDIIFFFYKIKGHNSDTTNVKYLAIKLELYFISLKMS